MTKTTAAAGRDPKDLTAPCTQSESHRQRPQHTRRASRTPSWPWPPIRMTARLTTPAVTCAACGVSTPPNRAWCEHCAAVL